MIRGARGMASFTLAVCVGKFPQNQWNSGKLASAQVANERAVHNGCGGSCCAIFMSHFSGKLGAYKTNEETIAPRSHTNTALQKGRRKLEAR